MKLLYISQVAAPLPTDVQAISHSLTRQSSQGVDNINLALLNRKYKIQSCHLYRPFGNQIEHLKACQSLFLTGFGLGDD